MRFVCLGFVFAVACAQNAAAQTYPFGYTWNRETQWVPGPMQGSTIGNPAPDPIGAPVWAYENVPVGGPLGDPLEWFRLRRSSQVWDGSWFNSHLSAWALADDTNPPIFDNRMTHNLVDGNYERVPVVRWLNPTGETGVFDVTGTLTVLWTGDNFTGEPVDVDVIIAKDADTPLAGEAVELLWSATVSKPNPGATVGDTVTLDVELRDVPIDDDGWLMFSLRGRDQFSGAPGRWVVLFDYGMNITLVPAPGAVLGLLLGGGLLTTRRRR